MRPRVLVVVAALVTVVAVVGALLLTRAEEPGTDAHLHIDPITTADEVAVAVMVGLHTWTPAEQESTWDAMHAISERLTGRLAKAAASRPDPDPVPREWESWARSGDRIIGASELVPDQEPIQDGAARATRRVSVRQTVLHAGGFTTPLDGMVAVVELERIEDQWKASDFRYESVGTTG